MTILVDADRAVAWLDRAHDLVERGLAARAEPLARRALATFARASGRGHPDTAHAAIVMGHVRIGLDDARGAALRYRAAASALGRFRDPPEEVHVLRIQALRHLANARRSLGDHAHAARTLTKAIAEARRRLGADHLEIAILWNDLGVLRKAQGRTGDAARAYRFARAILSPYPTRLDDLATLDHNLAGLDHERGRFRRAEPIARRGLALRIRLHGHMHPSTIADLAALAAILQGLKRNTEAEHAYRTCLTYYRRRGPQFEVGFNLVNLAILYATTGRDTRARTLAADARDILVATAGRHHPETERARGVLADLGAGSNSRG